MWRKWLRPGGEVVIYDFPFAPFDELAGAGHLSAAPRSRVRIGIPFVKCERMVLTG